MWADHLAHLVSFQHLLCVGLRTCVAGLTRSPEVGLLRVFVILSGKNPGVPVPKLRIFSYVLVISTCPQFLKLSFAFLGLWL